MSIIQCWTDGSCLVNPGGTGGWAAILRIKGQDTPELAISGAVAVSTNNRMEMTAVIEGLRAVKRLPSKIQIILDSQYVMQGFTEGWVAGWKANGWVGKKKKPELHVFRGDRRKPIPNVDLWRELDALVEKHHVTWTHIRGHQGNELNERCDKLAYRAAVAYRDSLKEQNDSLQNRVLHT